MTVFSAILKAVRKNPSSKEVFKERAAIIDTLDQLNDLADQIENGVEFGDEDVDVSEFRNGLASFVKNDQTLVRYLDDPFSCDYVE